MLQRVVDGVQDGVRPADDNEHLLAQIRSGIIQREALEAQLESKKREILRLEGEIEAGRRALKGLQLENGRLKKQVGKWVEQEK